MRLHHNCLIAYSAWPSVPYTFVYLHLGCVDPPCRHTHPRRQSRSSTVTFTSGICNWCIWTCLPLNMSSIELVFHWTCLPLNIDLKYTVTFTSVEVLLLWSPESANFERDSLSTCPGFDPTGSTQLCWALIISYTTVAAHRLLWGISRLSHLMISDALWVMG